jgi:hypothetical protein
MSSVKGTSPLSAKSGFVSDLADKDVCRHGENRHDQDKGDEHLARSEAADRSVDDSAPPSADLIGSLVRFVSVIRVECLKPRGDRRRSQNHDDDQDHPLHALDDAAPADRAPRSSAQNPALQNRFCAPDRIHGRPTRSTHPTRSKRSTRSTRPTRPTRPTRRPSPSGERAESVPRRRVLRARGIG